VSRALVRPWRGIAPKIDATAWLAPSATVIGDVEIGAGSSVWFGTIVRGDVNFVRIGRGTNIQDGSVVHVTRKRFGTVIGDGVLVGHMAMIHGCTIGDGAFIGMKACVSCRCRSRNSACIGRRCPSTMNHSIGWSVSNPARNRFSRSPYVLIGRRSRPLGDRTTPNGAKASAVSGSTGRVCTGRVSVVMVSAPSGSVLRRPMAFPRRGQADRRPGSCRAMPSGRG